MRKNLLLLFALLLSAFGLTGKAQVVFQTSTAPGDDWAADTHWYRILCNDGNGWLSTGSSYLSSECLRLSNQATDLTDNGLWCIVGDDENGYKFYNKASGVTKMLGMTGEQGTARGKMYTETEASSATATTTFYKTASNASGVTNGFCFRMASTGNNYLNNRNSGDLALWNSSDAVNVKGSAFTFYEPTLTDPTTFFTYVASVDNITDATWQAVTSKSTQNSKYYWNLADDGTTITTSAYTGAMDEFPETAQWAFIGDATSGFKIYNRAKQKYVTAKRNTSSTADQFATLSDEGSTFYASNFLAVAPANAFVLTSEKGSRYYLNWASSKLLISWDAGSDAAARTDVGNAIVAVTAQDLIKAAQDVNWTTYTALNSSWQSMQANVLTNAVGYPSNEDKASMNTACTNKSNYATAKSLYAKYTTVADGYYRLVNAQKQTSNGTTMYLTPEVSGTNLYLYKKSGTGKDVNNVVKITTNTAGQHLLSVNGKTISVNPGRASGGGSGRRFSLVEEASAGKFTITSANITGLFAIAEQTTVDGNYNCLHSNGADGTQVVNWSYSSSSDNASLWYIVPAEDAEVALNALDGKSYATAYLPFNATISTESKVKAYTGALNDAKTALNLTEISTIPAATGVLLVDETDAATKVTLKISTDEATATTDLTGTYFPITLTSDQKSQYLVFGKHNDVPGFYYPGENLTTIGMNKAYLDKNTGAAGEAISLIWNGQTTGISSIEGAQTLNAAPVYDLSGRRISTPVKGGVYIQAGKKFVK